MTDHKYLEELERLETNVALAKVALRMHKARRTVNDKSPPSRPRVEASQYIIDNAGWLTEEEIEFLQQPNHSPKAVAERLDMSESTVKRMCEKGQLSHSKPNGRYRIESVSVMEYLDHAKTEKKT